MKETEPYWAAKCRAVSESRSLALRALEPYESLFYGKTTQAKGDQEVIVLL